jgi:xanthosine utilization system XapX-like protein
MHPNLIGPAAGLAAFLGIWLGHVAVREIERRSASVWLPAAVFLLAGLLLESGALLAPQPPTSAILGILGITAGWDTLELFRQQRRVQRGHAPANPSNPRHAHILAEFPAATTLDLLDRQPLGRPVTAEEALTTASGKHVEASE